VHGSEKELWQQHHQEVLRKDKCPFLRGMNRGLASIPKLVKSCNATPAQRY